MPLQRFQMIYNNEYQWDLQPDDPNVNFSYSEPDHTLLNRNNGAQVLQFINYIIDKHLTMPVATETYEKLEKMVKVARPTYIPSYMQIEQWILANYSIFDRNVN